MDAALRVALVALLAVSCGGRLGATPTPSEAPAASATPKLDDEQVIRARADQAVRALGARDFAAFALLVHPQLGARFTPYTFIEPADDVVLVADEIKRGFANTRRYLWGYTDGKGDPMDWTFEQYFTTQLWDRDYAKAPQVRFDHYPENRGNMFDNTQKIHPAGRTVEYHYPGSGDQLDWSGLRLVFEDHGDGWYIVAVIHDEWTI